MSWLQVLYLIYNHDTQEAKFPSGVNVNGKSTSSHDISVLCHLTLPLALKSAQTRPYFGLLSHGEAIRDKPAKYISIRAW